MPDHQFVVDVLDSTWIHARPAAIGAVIAEPANWRRWWPGLDLVADEVRGSQGIKWTVRAVAEVPDARLHGVSEIWLQPSDDGVIVHFFLWLDPAAGCTITDRAVTDLSRRYRRLAKRAFWALSDRLDPDRFTRHTSTGHASV